jgi:hypothetical protein
MASASYENLIATKHHPDFSRYQQLAQSLTEQFWAQHYPGDDLTEVGLDFPFLRAQAEELVALITSTPSP